MGDGGGVPADGGLAGPADDVDQPESTAGAAPRARAERRADRARVRGGSEAALL